MSWLERVFWLVLFSLIALLLLVLTAPWVGAGELQQYPPVERDGTGWGVVLWAAVVLAGFVFWKVVTTCDDNEED